MRAPIWLKYFVVIITSLGLLLCLLISVSNLNPTLGGVYALTAPSIQAADRSIELKHGAYMAKKPTSVLEARQVGDNVTTQSLTNTQVNEKDQLLPLAELFRNLGPGEKSESATPPTPYLLADYAAQCKAYMGTVPEFSCTKLDHPNIKEAKIITVDKSKAICPHLGGDADPNCNINGTVEGRLITPTDAPSGTKVTILFSCRVYNHGAQPGRYVDIAVIQHDQTTGNTCWFQSPTVPALDKAGNLQKDEEWTEKSPIYKYKDFDGTVIPSPMAPGAETFWLHPYDPDDAFTSDPQTDPLGFLKELRQGKRGIVADKNCQRCHDADPFIYVPFVSSVHHINPITPTTAITGWNPFGNYVSNFLGIFNADGVERTQAWRFSPEFPTGVHLERRTCNTCHTFGANTMHRQPKLPNEPFKVNGKLVVPLADISFTDAEQGNPWMPPVPLTDTEYFSLTREIRDQLHDCAEHLTRADCHGAEPPPITKTNVKLTTESFPATLVAGHEVRYTIFLENRGPFTGTAAALKLTDTLPAGVNFVSSPDHPGCKGSKVVMCGLEDVANNTSLTITLVSHIEVTVTHNMLTNTVEVWTNKSQGEINIKTIKVQIANAVRNDADLAISQNATVEPIIAANPPTFKLKYVLTVANQGPAVAGVVTLTQNLPDGASFDSGLSSPSCTEKLGLVNCQLKQLTDHKISQVNIFATIPASKGPFFKDSAHVVTEQEDRNLANNEVTEVLIDRAAVQQVFMPLVARPPLRGVDLVVKSIAMTAETPQVVIQNIGEAPVLPGDGFWVDLYINPKLAPTHVNQRADDDNGQGLVWGIVSPALRLDPGQSYTLTVGDLYYAPEHSRFPTLIPAGSKLYVQVDSANKNSTDGAVLEEHEIKGGPYNNISSVILSAAVPTAYWRLSR